MIRNFLITFLFLTYGLFAQRDTVINKMKCHLISDNKDTGTVWIQKKSVNKGIEKLNGSYFEFYPGGQLKAKGFYKNGKSNDKWLRYYKNGKLSEEGYFDKGLKSDYWATYFESGQMSWKGNYFKNMRSGVWRYFYEDGKLKAMTRYRIKTESIKRKAKPGEKGISAKANVEIHYHISPADSIVEYYPDGKLRTRILYGNEGGLVGDIDFYYEDGSKNMHGKYIQGKKTSSWEWFCPNGMVYKSEKYTLGSDIPEIKQSADVCTFKEIIPWMKWQEEIIIQ